MAINRRKAIRNMLLLTSTKYIRIPSIFTTSKPLLGNKSKSGTEIHFTFTHLLNPREHPDDARRYVKPPTWEVFGNQTHFAIMRGFQMKDGKLINYVKDFELYTKAFNLGDVIWPGWRILTATNIPDMLHEMKMRNLYLFDIWGYLPGSSPNQFQLSEETSQLFESELGDKWLGMDMGEQAGRYILGYAKSMYPSSANRFEQYLHFHQHISKIENDLKNKMAALTVIPYAHYLLKEGFYTLIGSETAQESPNAQVFYVFNRGAGKQYGVPWWGNASVYNRWGWKTYGEAGKSSGPTKGTSLSLLKKLLYSHILYNCMIAGFESGWINNDKLTPLGQIQQSAHRWVKEWGSPGVLQTPIALMLDFYAGWINPSYNGLLYRIWGNLPYGHGDYLTHNVLNLLYPGYQDASFFHDESGFITATPFGDAADALLSDAPIWSLKHYPVLVVAGELSGGIEINDKLQEYVEQGGALYITAGSLKNLPRGIGGIECGSKLMQFSEGEEVVIRNRRIKEKYNFELAQLHTANDVQTIVTIRGQKAVVTKKLGNGTVTVFASPFGQSSVPAVSKTVVQIEDEPLVNPYPMLEHVRIILESGFRNQQLFEVGEGLSLITCCKGTGDYTLGILNNSWSQLPFNIRSHIGDVKMIKELPIDQSERVAIGYLPEKLEGKNVGANNQNAIEGGSIRIFNVKVNESGVTQIPYKIPPSYPQDRLLPLRAVESIQTEILARPTFFQRFDGVVIDWKYLSQRKGSALEEEKRWLHLQKIKIWVDLTSGIDLFPDLRLVDNIEHEYQGSMKIINDVINKMGIIGSHNLIISLHTTVENNFTISNTWKDMQRSVIEICVNAKILNTMVYLRVNDGNKLPHNLDDAIRFLNRVGMPNLRLALSTAELIASKKSPDVLDEKLKNIIGVWLVNSPKRDLTDRLWNPYSPIASSGYSEKIENLLRVSPDIPMISDVVFENHDQEYLESRALDEIMNKIRNGN